MNPKPIMNEPNSALQSHKQTKKEMKIIKLFQNDQNPQFNIEPKNNAVKVAQSFEMRKPQFNMQRVSENITGEANQKYFTDSNSIR